jgi:hypothetical protein
VTYLDFFSELISEITGEPREDIKRNIIEYLESIEKSDLIHKKIPRDHAESLREAARADPSLFRSFLAKGWLGALKDITTH